MILSLTVAVLVGGGMYLLLQRSMVRAVFGLTLISHGVNLGLLIIGVPAWRGEAIVEPYDETGRAAAHMADPLPQAFVLTAIVISLAATIFMLALAVIGRSDDMFVHPATGDPRDDAAALHDDDPDRARRAVPRRDGRTEDPRTGAIPVVDPGALGPDPDPDTTATRPRGEDA
ncbi:cation:proton antiporter subunit C [Brachybacterium sp. EF45031]|nr:cation:proton antiporter subunit C [Brachybacterium sillae]